MVNHDIDLYDLKIRAGSKTAVIHTTSNHPFWIPAAPGNGGYWAEAGTLRYGTRLRIPSGRTATVIGGWTPQVKTGWMWDITVPGNNDHDFYIVTTAAPILVHNCSEDLQQIEEHVIPRHTPGGAEADPVKSLFDPGTDLEKLAEGSAGQIGRWQQETANIRYIIKSNSIVGNDLNGLPTNIYTIIRDGYSGDLVTMHPGVPTDLAG